MFGVTVLSDQAAIKIPPEINSLDEFRRWTTSPSFPTTARIDFIDGEIEVDKSLEEFFSHGGPKEAIARTLGPLVHAESLGYLRIDRIRVVAPAAQLSTEPDLLFVSHESLDSDAVRLLQKRRGGEDSCLEVAGGPDLCVEIVSRTSVAKDTSRLPRAYFAAGVKEFWRVDALGSELVFQIFVRGKARFRRSTTFADGYQKSVVFQRAFQLVRERDARGHWGYELRVRS